MAASTLWFALGCLALAACSEDSLEGNRQRADDRDGSTQSVCGVEISGFEFRGSTEIGELDLDPRLSANALAAQLNADLDCKSSIDTCASPRYSITADELHIYVEVGTDENTQARQFYADGELVAEERFGDCKICKIRGCPAPDAAP